MQVVRDSIKDMGAPSLGPRVPTRKDSLELLRNETTIIDFDRGPGYTLGCNGVCQGREGQFVSEEGVSSVPEQPETLGNPITVPESKGD